MNIKISRILNITLISDATSSSEQQSHLQTKLKSLSCELSSLQNRLPPPGDLNAGVIGDSSSPGDSSGTMVVRPSPPLKYQHQNGSAPSLHQSHLQPSVFTGKYLFNSNPRYLNFNICQIFKFWISTYI